MKSHKFVYIGLSALMLISAGGLSNMSNVNAKRHHHNTVRIAKRYRNSIRRFNKKYAKKYSKRHARKNIKKHRKRNKYIRKHNSKHHNNRSIDYSHKHNVHYRLFNPNNL